MVVESHESQWVAIALVARVTQQTLRAASLCDSRGSRPAQHAATGGRVMPHASHNNGGRTRLHTSSSDTAQHQHVIEQDHCCVRTTYMIATPYIERKTN